MQHIHKTEQERMRKLLPYYIIFIVFGFVSFQWGCPAFTAFVQKQRPDVALLIYLSILVMLALPGLALGVYGFRMARRIIATGQVPPRMKELVRGPKLDESGRARRTGRLVYFMSLVLVMCSIAAVTLCYMLYRSFDNTHHKSFSGPKITSGEKP